MQTKLQVWRDWLTSMVKNRFLYLRGNVCERCGKTLSGDELPVNLLGYGEHHQFCCLQCRGEWLQRVFKL